MRAVGASGRTPNLTGMLVLHDAGRSLGLQTAKGFRRLGTTDAPIVSVAADHSSDGVAWVDQKGRVGICNLAASGRFLVGTPVKGSARFHFTLEKVTE